MRWASSQPLTSWSCCWTRPGFTSAPGSCGAPADVESPCNTYQLNSLGCCSRSTRMSSPGSRGILFCCTAKTSCGLAHVPQSSQPGWRRWSRPAGKFCRRMLGLPPSTRTASQCVRSVKSGRPSWRSCSGTGCLSCQPPCRLSQSLRPSSQPGRTSHWRGCSVCTAPAAPSPQPRRYPRIQHSVSRRHTLVLGLAACAAQARWRWPWQGRRTRRRGILRPSLQPSRCPFHHRLPRFTHPASEAGRPQWAGPY